MFTEEQAKGYLAGLIDGEGHVSSKHKLIHIGNTEKDIMDAATECCETLDLHCTPYEPRQYRPGNRKQIYEVRIRTQESLQRIHDEVPIASNRKREALAEALTRFKRSPRPSPEWLHEKYVQDGLTGPEIAELANTSHTRVYNWLRQAGIPIHASRGWPSVEQKRPSKEWLLRRYVEERQSPRRLADELGVSRTTIFRWLDRYEIPRNRPHVTEH